MVGVDNEAQIVNIDDVMCVTEETGDEDDFYSAEVLNNYYIYNQGIAPIYYWDMATAAVAIMLGGTNLACKAMRKLGERLCLYHIIDTGVAYPQRVQWTVAGGVSIPPAATDWTDPGSGNTDLESTMGSDFILAAEKLSNYVVIYGERTIVSQEYTGVVASPYAFYTRITGVGLAAPRAIVNLGEEHIFLGWDNVYSYKGGASIDRIGDAIENELFTIMNPEYIHRSFLIYIEETDEIRLHFPLVGETLPNTYFTYKISNQSWSRGSRIYSAFGYFSKVTSVTWHTYGGDGNVPWDEATARWQDSTLEALAPLNLYGDTSGILYQDNESSYDNADGTAIDGYWESKDFVTGDGYRRTMTNWMELGFEAKGATIDVSYSTDFGVTWSTVETFTLTTAWAQYRHDFNANSPQIRFKFRNAVQGETFDVRQIELGMIEATDRGV